MKPGKKDPTNSVMADLKFSAKTDPTFKARADTTTCVMTDPTFSAKTDTTLSVRADPTTSADINYNPNVETALFKLVYMLLMLCSYKKLV